jgi:4-carboxymuconolactone decarboxylase
MMKLLVGGLIAMSIAGAAGAQERFPELKREQMSPAQQKAAEAIAAGPRGGLRGPFNACSAAGVRGPAQRVGEYIRYNSMVPKKLNEFAILITARHWNAKYEWYAHYPLAIQAGLKPQIAADLAQGRRPRGMGEDEAAVYDFSTELRRDRQVSDATYARAMALLGEVGIVDLIGVNGYYDLVSMTLNTARVATPADGALPLPDLKP